MNPEALKGGFTDEEDRNEAGLREALRNSLIDYNSLLSGGRGEFPEAVLQAESESLRTAVQRSLNEVHESDLKDVSRSSIGPIESPPPSSPTSAKDDWLHNIPPDVLRQDDITDLLINAADSRKNVDDRFVNHRFFLLEGGDHQTESGRGGNRVCDPAETSEGRATDCSNEGSVGGVAGGASNPAGSVEGSNEGVASSGGHAPAEAENLFESTNAAVGGALHTERDAVCPSQSSFDGGFTELRGGSLGMQPFPREEKRKVFQVIFGVRIDQVGVEDILRWFNHTFIYGSHSVLNWGLHQKQGGPCGVLASIQGLILRRLLFNRGAAAMSSTSSNNQDMEVALLESTENQEFSFAFPCNFSEEARWLALIDALCVILFQCTMYSSYTLLYISSFPPQRGSQQLDFGDSEILSKSFDKISDVMEFLYKNPHFITAPSSILSFIASVIATRGVMQVKQDMDDDYLSMVGKFGHCSQEMVNLLLTGKATTNVFDGTRSIGTDDAFGDSLTLSGVTKRPAIGFLTEFEGLRYMEVGNYYKHPYYPIWIIGSSNHYTTLFATDLRVSRLSERDVVFKEAEKVFNHYDFEGNKYILSEFLINVLQDCGMSHAYDDAKRSLDIDCGVIVFRDFFEWYFETKMISKSMEFEDLDPPSSVALYLYDGQDPPGPSLRRFIVESTDIPCNVGQSNMSSASRFIWTRWPNSIVSEAGVISSSNA